MASHLRPSKSSPIPFLLLFFFILAIPTQSQDSAQPDVPPPKEEGGGIDGVEKLENAEDGQSDDQSAQPPPAQSGGGQSASPKCGTAESDFAPCLARERADQLFKHCCSQYVPVGCHSLCKYEADELTARNLLLQAVKTKKCDLKHFGTILYCASQNQDNRKCCQHLNLADSKLGVGERCLRFCDPGGEGGIESIARSDVTCLFNWNVLMYCHHAGIKLV